MSRMSPFTYTMTSAADRASTSPSMAPKYGMCEIGDLARFPAGAGT